MTRLNAWLTSEHKVVAGPRTLLFMAVVFAALLAVVHADAGPGAVLVESWLRAGLGAAAIMSVLVWAERERPHRADLPR